MFGGLLVVLSVATVVLAVTVLSVAAVVLAVTVLLTAVHAEMVYNYSDFSPPTAKPPPFPFPPQLSPPIPPLLSPLLPPPLPPLIT